MMIKKILLYIIYSFFISTFLFYIPNKSNFSKFIIIPIITLLIVKYIWGDFDKGFVFTYLDIVFLFVMLFSSYLTIYLLNSL